MMPPDTISLEFLARQLALLLEEHKNTRAENREIRRTFTLISESFSRQERRVSELRDDIETMLKLEIGGTFAHLETRLEIAIDSRFTPLELRIDKVETRLIGIEHRLDGMDRRFDDVDRRLNGMDDKLDAILAAVSHA